MLTFELGTVDRLATSAVVVGKVAALEHELQRTRPRQGRLFLEGLREPEPSRRWFVMISSGDFSRMNRPIGHLHPTR
jgi:hypothetical protein